MVLALAGCTFDASGLGETPQTGAGAGSTMSTTTLTTEPLPSTGEPTSEDTVGVSGSGSMSESTSGPTGDPTSEPPLTTTTEPDTTTEPVMTTTTGPDTTTEPCPMVMAYKDFDNDNYGDPSMPMMVCEGTQGWVPDNTDCNDMTANAHPGVTEMCDTIDNDCDGLFDEYDAATNNTNCLDCDFKVREDRLYYFCKPEREWDPAEQFCVSQGLHLAKDDGGGEHDWLVQQIGNTGLWWIGGKESGGTFKWVSDGTNMAGDGWGGGEPNNIGWLPPADCVILLDSNGVFGYIGGGGKWNDHGCGEEEKSICEGPLP